VQRFLNEAQIQASLQHPNIATLYDFCEFNGSPCIIMEYIEGQTLTDWIRGQGALPLAEAIAIFKAVVEALDYVHNRGVIHRDIKSNNVKLTATGQVKLLDFGIAKSTTSPTLTATGGIIGTLQYMSPEQFKGAKADERTDIWALGVLFYEILTGHMPFEAETLGALIERISRAEFKPPANWNSQIPNHVAAIVTRCLHKTPAGRYPSARALIQELDQAAQSPTPPVPRRTRSILTLLVAKAPVPQPFQRLASPVAPRLPASRKPLLWVGLALLALMLLTVCYLAFFSPGEGLVGDQRTYVIETQNGQAEVYLNGRWVGPTPYRFMAKPGDKVDFLLRREGFQDLSDHFTLGVNKLVYTYVMDQAQ
jgi:serine/threonine protein kinase